jgi:hypothetical protein
MLAKKTVKNQITLPKAIVRQLPDATYFDVSLRDGDVVLKPVVVAAAGERLRTVRARINALGLTEQDIDSAIRWTRARRR